MRNDLRDPLREKRRPARGPARYYRRVIEGPLAVAIVRRSVPADHVDHDVDGTRGVEDLDLAVGAQADDDPVGPRLASDEVDVGGIGARRVTRVHGEEVTGRGRVGRGQVEHHGRRRRRDPRWLAVAVRLAPYVERVDLAAGQGRL